MTRRDFLESSAALASAGLLGGCAPHGTRAVAVPALPFYDRVPPLAPIRADDDRLFKITVCTRPFRAAGPRVEAERVGEQLVVHNYGHGGSGWSLSWGSGVAAVDLALSGRDPSATDVAVIGCGALGLTAAVVAQRAGARTVTIYAKDRVSETRSFKATGSWTPDSRVALTKDMAAGFPAQWEAMARISWHSYQSFLGMAGNPVEFTDRYFLSDPHPEVAERQQREGNGLDFVYLKDRIADLNPHFQDLPAGTHPFPTKWARRRTDLMFNITDYAHQLTEDFQLNGGKIVHREFHSPGEFAQLAQPVVLNCTGYAARALFGDNSLTPVRGQIGWLIPQPEVNYGILWNDLILLSRRDGIVVQLNEGGDSAGWNDSNEQPDRGEAERGVAQLRSLYSRMAPPNHG